MGDIFETRTRSVRFTTRVSATDAIERVDLIKNHTIAFARPGSGKEMTFE